MGKKRSKIPGKFDPFTNRSARDIRNSLSEAFAEALGSVEPGKYLDVARRWQDAKRSAVYTNYVQDRLQRYDRVLKTIREKRCDNPLQQALVVWNQGLFFEFHDLLEPRWQAATGDNRQALKGLIKAAAVYIHQEQGHRQAAQSLAVKSHALLRQYRHRLRFIANMETLLEKLKAGDPVPPRLDFAPVTD